MKFELGFYLSPHGQNRQLIMQELSDCGIKWVGIDGSSWNAEHEKEQIMEFKNELTVHGLCLYSMHSCLPLLAMPDRPVPDDLLHEHILELKKGQLLGSNRIVYHSCHFRDCSFDNSDKAIADVGERLFIQNYSLAVNNLASVAADLNIVPVFENIYLSSYSESFDLLSHILDLSETTNVGICADTGHAFLGGSNPANKIRRAGKWLKDTHFHDNFGKSAYLPPRAATNKSPYRYDLHLPPGMGLINWPDVCMALREVEYSAPVMFEGIFGPGDSIEKGYFGGNLSYKELIKLTINNWRAFELLAE